MKIIQSIKTILITSMISMGFISQTRAADQYITDLTEIDVPEGTLFEMIAPLLLQIINFMMSVIGFIAIGFIIFSGYLLITAQGNEQQIEQGKKSLVNAILGLIVAVSGVIIVTTIQSWIGL